MKSSSAGRPELAGVCSISFGAASTKGRDTRKLGNNVVRFIAGELR